MQEIKTKLDAPSFNRGSIQKNQIVLLDQKHRVNLNPMIKRR